MEVKILSDVYVSPELNKNPEDVKALIAEYLSEQRRICARTWGAHKLVSIIGYLAIAILILLVSSLVIYKNAPIMGIIMCWSIYDSYNILCRTSVQNAFRQLISNPSPTIEESSAMSRDLGLGMIAIFQIFLFGILWKMVLSTCIVNDVYNGLLCAFYPGIVLIVAAITFLQEQKADTYAAILTSLLHLTVEDFKIHETDDVDDVDFDQHLPSESM